MSNKNKNNTQPKGKQIIDLANLAVATTVAVRLPALLEKTKINIVLMEAYLRAKLLNKKLTQGQTFVCLYLGKQQTFLIQSILCQDQQKKDISMKKDKNVDSCGSFVANNQTKIMLLDSQVKKKEQIEQLSSFYGYESQLLDLQHTIEKALFHRQQLIKNGLGPLKGVLISGYSGAGKTAMLRQTKRKFNNEKALLWKQISSIAMLSRVVGGAEEIIRNMFVELKKQQPAVLVIQDVHLLFGVKEVSSHQTVLAALLAEMESIQWESVVVVATYNTTRQLTKSIRSSGKFQKQIFLNLPNHNQRLTILNGLISRLSLKQQFNHQSLKKMNLRMNGFSVGQMKQILRQCYNLWGASMEQHHMDVMLKKYRPAQIKQLIVQVPEVYWKQIGGYEDVKRQIKKVVQLPLTHANQFAKFGIQPSKGILLYGPPGCSKTMMAKAIATQSKLNFISVKGPQLFSKYVGDSEQAIRNIFKRARACSPCVIFFDQIDALATQRSSNTDVSDRVLCQLLNEMDGIEGLKQVAIVAATNRPQILDKALLRPGRFDGLIYVSPPNHQARRQIFAINLSKSVPESQVGRLSEQLANKTIDYTGAQIALVCRQAVMLALQDSIQNSKPCEFIQQIFFSRALEKVKKRLTAETINKYQSFRQKLRE